MRRRTRPSFAPSSTASVPAGATWYYSMPRQLWLLQDTPTASVTPCHWLPMPSIRDMPASVCSCWWSSPNSGQWMWRGPVLLMLLVLVGRKLIYRQSLLWRTLLLAENVLLLAKTTLLLIVHLPGWSSHLRSANGRRLVWSAQQDVLLVHRRVVDELPLVAGLLLVVDADGRILAHTGDADDGSPAKRLIATGWIGSRRRASLLVAV